MRPEPESTGHDRAADVHALTVNGRETIIIGTAHISRESVELVRRVIETEKPDCVCVELDERRFAALAAPKKFSSLDIKEVIKKKQLSTLLINLVLSSYQKKLGGQLGVLPGTELLEAARVAEEHRLHLELCDRDIRVTMRRAWHATSFFKKGYLLATLLASLFERVEISEEKLAELKKKDVLSELMAELGTALPDLKKVLIDERDFFLAEKIKAAPGQKLVAVVGAGHVEGIVERLMAAPDPAAARLMTEIGSLPAASGFWKILGWLIPAAIIGAIGLIGWQKGQAAAHANLQYWILANGIPSAFGALLALAHPLTIAAAFAAAPVTSLTPVIGAGYVTAFVQVMLQPPLVKEFEAVMEDMTTWQGWWKNRLLKVFLAFLLPGFGSMIGTWIGGYQIISSLF